MSDFELIEFATKLNNGDGNTRAKIHLKRKLFSNEDEKKFITVVWYDENWFESECAYFLDLPKDVQKTVLKEIDKFDAEQVKKTL